MGDLEIQGDRVTHADKADGTVVLTEECHREEQVYYQQPYLGAQSGKKQLNIQALRKPYFFISIGMFPRDLHPGKLKCPQLLSHK